MRNYELVTLLGEAKATKKIKIHICLSLQELMNGEQIDKDLYCVTLDIDDFDEETGVISTTLYKE